MVTDRVLADTKCRAVRDTIRRLQYHMCSRRSSPIRTCYFFGHLSYIKTEVSYQYHYPQQKKSFTLRSLSLLHCNDFLYPYNSMFCSYLISYALFRCSNQLFLHIPEHKKKFTYIISLHRVLILFHHQYLTSLTSDLISVLSPL